MSNQLASFFSTAGRNAADFFIVLGHIAEAVYMHLRQLIAKIGQEGWRPTFAWLTISVVTLAMFVAFVVLPYRGTVLPEYYYNALIVALGLIIAAIGIRTVEKVADRYVSNKVTF